MIDEETRVLYHRAEMRHGTTCQTLKAAEEAAELSAAIVRHVINEDEPSLESMAEEIADTEIMCEQLRQIYGHRLIDQIKKQKLARLKARLDEVEE